MSCKTRIGRVATASSSCATTASTRRDSTSTPPPGLRTRSRGQTSVVGLGTDDDVKSAATRQVRPDLEMNAMRGQDLAADASSRGDDQYVSEMIPRAQRAVEAHAPSEQPSRPRPILQCRNQKSIGPFCTADHTIELDGFRARTRPGVELTGHNSR